MYDTKWCILIIEFIDDNHKTDANREKTLTYGTSSKVTEKYVLHIGSSYLV